jgi:D-glycero-beta-D-manno-heptose-7-phosphate kinase
LRPFEYFATIFSPVKDISKTVSELFCEKTVVIVGDLVADQFLNGTISRVSREAPVFILRHEETKTVPGAAANAAANVASLGGSARLIGVIGDDANGETLLTSLDEAGVDTSGIVRVEGRQTTTKVRVLAAQHYAARQQVIRIDYENAEPLPEEVLNELLLKIDFAARFADAIIISDYNYGAVTDQIFSTASRITESRSIPLILDSRFRLADFGGATTATPNREEVEQILGAGFKDADCEKLRKELDLKSLLVTNGNQGMKLFEKGREPLQIDVVGSKEPVDVTGAGDTVIAAYALALASGSDFEEAANIANHAGGLVVMKKGTACVTIAELAASLSAVEPLTSSKPA